ncbi:unnamed protein product, partial [Meganyctiphanes norvegica]
ISGPSGSLLSNISRFIICTLAGISGSIGSMLEGISGSIGSMSGVSDCIDPMLAGGCIGPINAGISGSTGFMLSCISVSMEESGFMVPILASISVPNGTMPTVIPWSIGPILDCFMDPILAGISGPSGSMLTGILDSIAPMPFV